MVDESARPAGGRGPRGAGFPALALPEAVDIIKAAAAHGRQHPMQALAGYTGHATANSGPFRQKLAALKDWGLVVVQGDIVRLTDRGMGIGLPASPAAELDMQLSAFQGCGIFWQLYNDTAKGVSLHPMTLGNNAVTMLGVSPKTRDKFVRSFIDSAVAVGLAESLPTGEVRLAGAAAGGTATGSPLPAVTGQAAPVQSGPPEPASQAAPAADDSGLRPVISQIWRNGETEIIFEVRSRTPLPSVAFMEIGTAVTSIEVLWEALQQPGA